MAQRRRSRLPEIIEYLKDEKRSLVKASRLVSIEIAELVAEMQECRTETELQACVREVKTLEALGESINRIPVSVEPDELNFEGPKWQHFLREMLRMCEEAAEKALGKGKEADVRQIMKNLKDQMAAGMPELRREVKNIGLSTGTDASKSDNAKNGSEGSG